MYYPLISAGLYTKNLDYFDDELIEDILRIRDTEKNPYGVNHTFNEDSTYPDTDSANELMDLIDATIQTDIHSSLVGDMVWSHVVKPNESTAPHTHDNRTNPYSFGISWVYYLQSSEGCGDLSFQTYVQSKLFITNLSPEPGLLCIFPDWVTHYTLPNRTNENRISISGNHKMHSDHVDTFEDENLIEIIGNYS